LFDNNFERIYDQPKENNLSRVLVPKYKIDRRLGVNLWGRAKSPFNTNPARPGMHGKSRKRRVSNYGMQLAQKQRLQFYYGMKENQFRLFFIKSRKVKTGNVFDAFVGMLESRLDAFVYRMKWTPTIFASKQLVKHKHVLVNGKVVSVCSYLLKPNDIVSLKDSIKDKQIIANAIAMPDREIPAYYEVNENKTSAKFMKMPVLDEVPYPVKIDPSLIVEYYSRKV